MWLCLFFLFRVCVHIHIFLFHFFMVVVVVVEAADAEVNNRLNSGSVSLVRMVSLFRSFTQLQSFI